MDFVAIALVTRCTKAFCSFKSLIYETFWMNKWRVVDLIILLMSVEDIIFNMIKQKKKAQSLIWDQTRDCYSTVYCTTITALLFTLNLERYYVCNYFNFS